jgi:membrane protease YdiL (CAAX protease family)
MVRDFLVAIGAVLTSTLALVGTVALAGFWGVDPSELNGERFVMSAENLLTVTIILCAPPIIVLSANRLLIDPFPRALGLVPFEWLHSAQGFVVGAAILLASYGFRAWVGGWPEVSIKPSRVIGGFEFELLAWGWGAFALVMNSISEELVYRALPLRVASRHGFGRALSVVGTSLLFAGIHFLTRSPSLSDFAYLFLYGAVFCLLFLHTGSLWFVIGVHTGNNVVATSFDILWPSDGLIENYALSVVLAAVLVVLSAWIPIRKRVDYGVDRTSRPSCVV